MFFRDKKPIRPIEKSVAATKTFVTSVLAGLSLLAEWREDAALQAAVAALPEAFAKAIALDWSPLSARLSRASSAFVLGRGPGFAIANEAALKFKETSAIQAEAFSSAEVRHGPMALIDEHYPLLVFAPRGAEQAGLISLAAEMRQRGARVLLAAPDDVLDRDLTLSRAEHPSLDPILAIQSFYVMAAGLALARGMNPDQPRHLSKVTRTH